MAAFSSQASRAGDATQGSVPSQDAYVTRVFYLQGMETIDAITLLRSRVQIRHVAALADLGVIVAADRAERVDRSESVLREQNGVARAVDPHDPVVLAEPPGVATETRGFRLEGIAASDVVTVLRAIYQIRSVTANADGTFVSVQAPPAKLDASEALLLELGVLLEATGSAGAG
jgi:hypothetical protein